MSALKPHAWLGALDLYEAGRAKAPGARRVIKLSSNETPFGASPKAIAAFRSADASLHRYPDSSYLELKEAIAEVHGLDPARIACGVGSDEILKLACRAYAGPGDEVVYSRYGFMMYPIAARSVGAVPVEAPDRDFTADVDSLLRAVTPRTRVMFLANPNNPTGTCLPRQEVERLAANLPGHVLLVLDAAYAEYVSDLDYEAGAALTDKYPNVLMTRTFSKIYGIAALRLGWGYACTEVIEALERLRDPFNVPTPSQAAGVAAVRDQDWVRMSQDHNKKWRTWLSHELAGLGLDVVPSAANFVLMRFGPNLPVTAEEANAFLTKEGVLLRWLPKQGLADGLRMTVGTEEENREVLRLMTSLLKGAR
jgi:histidinol-phosphate aminotransferase